MTGQCPNEWHTWRWCVLAEGQTRAESYRTRAGTEDAHFRSLALTLARMRQDILDDLHGLLGLMGSLRFQIIVRGQGLRCKQQFHSALISTSTNCCSRMACISAIRLSTSSCTHRPMASGLLSSESYPRSTDSSTFILSTVHIYS